MARCSLLLALMILLRYASCRPDSCPNCRGYNLRSNSLTNATQDAEALDDLSPYCVVCTPVPGHRRRDVIPTCPLVRRTSTLWLRNFRLGSLSLSDLSHLKDVKTLYLHPVTTAVLLQWNRLETIGPGYFRQLSSLMLLDLRYNKIHTIYKVTKNRVTEWQNKAISCTSVFALGMENITAQQNVSEVQIISTVNGTDIDHNRHLVYFILKNDEINKASFNLLDLIITTLLTLSLLAFCYFVFQSLRKTAPQNIQNQNYTGTVNVQQNPVDFLHHTYETIEDQPQARDQNGVIPGAQIPTSGDDVIAPYGQTVLSVSYGKDKALNAIPSTYQSQNRVTGKKSVQTPYLKCDDQARQQMQEKI
ncbi:PREDICTED: uncharacterized protein LOC109467328 [Branchiostoma belcheri]|uniref:Uncharacterized protein LOC109467328 n=1 Tax=Branchiostoma belcheri TaxID=7741 RepID=A0A6P4YQ88_BRABE|nr:PREDICTED: uncharacterized protein LOC109467328 [Branchiostoma belcheri]